MSSRGQSPSFKSRRDRFGVQRASVSTGSPLSVRPTGARTAQTQSSTTLHRVDDGPGQDMSENWASLSEVAGPPPVENAAGRSIHRHRSIEDEWRRRRSRPRPEAWGSRTQLERTSSTGSPRERRRSTNHEAEDDSDAPDFFHNLTEVSSPPPVQNPDEQFLVRQRTLEDHLSSPNRGDLGHKKTHELLIGGIEPLHGSARTLQAPESLPPRASTSQAALTDLFSQHEESLEAQLQAARDDERRSHISSTRQRVSRFATQLYTISYLIFFSILGTLARLGIQWLTFYPGAPVITSVLWANFAGSLFFGFLAEDQFLFREEWGPEKKMENSFRPSEKRSDSVVFKDHTKIKKTIPLYIGLATGFCGSLTSFSSFMRDIFLALSNNLSTPGPRPSISEGPYSRKRGYSVEASLAVVILTLGLSLAALKLGAHIAIFAARFTPTIPFRFLRRILDPLIVFLGFGCWLGAILMSIWPPDRPGGPSGHSSWAAETWRGQALFACVFAPAGCLLRFYASLKLNGLVVAFPLGTFAVNIFGTAVEGMAYDLQHISFGSLAMTSAGGGRVGCQVLQGMMDGFCGCLTTVSTFVGELNGLRRGHAYGYGAASVVAGFCMMVVIMGSVRWSVGWQEAACVT